MCRSLNGNVRPPGSMVEDSALGAPRAQAMPSVLGALPGARDPPACRPPASNCPQALIPGHAGFAADATCTTFSVPTYVFEPADSSTVAGRRTLHKYMERGPESADTDLLDTQYTATLSATGKARSTR
ncbi:hypothetical protein [Streptomyces collinus]|uniref:hypothetical protein n=1 Tax=Streptomyces collinus TaxID=42684 RepID=UPI0038151A93